MSLPATSVHIMLVRVGTLSQTQHTKTEEKTHAVDEGDY